VVVPAPTFAATFEAVLQAGGYPAPPHRTAAFASLGHGPGSFPVAEQLAEEELSLPLFPGITDEQLEQVTTAIRTFFGRG
jgi:dTDP-4-amino-4,6-dideoxygalactose transaminase